MSQNQAKLQVVILGARGSISVSGPEYQTYGGATSSVLLKTPELQLVLDAGTGILRLPDYLKGNGHPSKKLHLFFSHYHLDHVIGLPMCALLFDPSVEIIFYAPDFLPDARRMLEELFRAPYWPVGLEHFKAKMDFVTLSQGSSRLAGSSMTVRTLPVAHPNGCCAYRFDWQGKGVVYATDCEPDEAGLEELAEFSMNADLLIIDAQYTSGEYDRFRGFGHTTEAAALTILSRSGVKQCLMFHHAPYHTDRELEELEQELGQRYPGVHYAREGSVIAI